MEGGGGEAELGGGGVAEFVEMEEAEGAGGVEVGDDVGGGDGGAGGPDGEDGGEVCHAAPLFDDVVDVEGFGAGEAEGGGGADFGWSGGLLRRATKRAGSIFRCAIGQRWNGHRRKIAGGDASATKASRRRGLIGRGRIR